MKNRMCDVPSRSPLTPPVQDESQVEELRERDSGRHTPNPISHSGSSNAHDTLRVLLCTERRVRMVLRILLYTKRIIRVLRVLQCTKRMVLEAKLKVRY